MTQDKGQSAVNGRSLNQRCNTVLSHLRASRPACRETVICGVASLGKGRPFPARRALPLTVSRHGDMYTLYVTPH
jgi:hypothetical protein